MPRTCHKSITQEPPSLEKARPQPPADHLIKTPCPCHSNGFPGRQPSRRSQRYCQMLLWESENLRFNSVSSRPCQVSPAETGPKCPTVYLAVMRFGSHSSPPQDGMARHGTAWRAQQPGTDALWGPLQKTRLLPEGAHPTSCGACPPPPAPALLTAGDNHMLVTGAARVPTAPPRLGRAPQGCCRGAAGVLRGGSGDAAGTAGKFSPRPLVPQWVQNPSVACVSEGAAVRTRPC